LLLLGVDAAVSARLHPARASDFELLREDTPAAALYLPRPGRPRIGRLAPHDQTSQDEAIAAAQRGEWSEAIDKLKDVRENAYCAPATIYNLALAYEGKGDATRAAVYFRAYLAEMPDASDAAAIKADLAKIRSKLAAEADRYADESERLAAALDAAPPKPGAKSLREAQYAKMISLDYAAGQVARAERLLARLRAIPTAEDYSNWSASHKQDAGAFMALKRGDRAGFRNSRFAGVFTAILDAREGDADGALQVLRRTPQFWGHEEAVVDALRAARAHAAIRQFYENQLRTVSQWSTGWFAGATYDIIRMFWDGRPDLAVALAREFQSYYKRYDIGYQRVDDDAPMYLALLAVLGDLDGIDDLIRRGLYNEYWLKQWMGIDQIAALLAATRPHDVARITSTVAALEKGEYEMMKGEYKRKGFSGEPSRHRVGPAGSFVLAILQGDRARAAAIAGDQDHLSQAVMGVPRAGSSDSLLGSPLYSSWDDVGRLMLRFAVTTGQYEFLPPLLQHVRTETALYELERLAADGENSTVEATLRPLEERVCQGWRPRDSAQARAVWEALKRADAVANDESYKFPTIEEIRKCAQDAPDALPDKLFDTAIGMYLALTEIDRRIPGD
jgi:hypothetical protein